MARHLTSSLGPLYVIWFTPSNGCKLIRQQNLQPAAPPADLPNGSSRLSAVPTFSELFGISSPTGLPNDANDVTFNPVPPQSHAFVALDQPGLYPQQSIQNGIEPFRPSSAQSYSRSEYSGFSETDVDTDSVMSETSFSLQPNNDNVTDLGLGAMGLSSAPNQFWMEHNHTQAVAGGGAFRNGVKLEPQGTVAPNSVSPSEQSNSARVASGSPEKDHSALERKPI